MQKVVNVKKDNDLLNSSIVVDNEKTKNYSPCIKGRSRRLFQNPYYRKRWPRLLSQISR